MKTISIIILILICVQINGDDAKIKEVIKKTHSSVQKLIKDKDLTPNKRRVKIIQAVRAGEKSIDNMRRHYVLRHAFKEAKKIKASLVAFKKIDFSKEKLTVSTKEDTDIAQDDKGSPKASRTKKGKGPKASYYLGLQNFQKLSPAEKEKIIRKTVKSDKEGLLKIESNNYIIHSDYSSYKLVELMIQLEWIAYVYNSIFNTENNKVVKKPTLYLMKESKKLEAIVLKKNLKYSEQSSEYDVKQHFFYRSSRSMSFNYYQREIFVMLGHTYGKPFLRQYSFSILKSFSSLRMHASLESLRRESLFDYSMSYKSLRQAKEMKKDFAAFAKKLSNRGLPSHDRDLIAMFSTFLFYKGYFKDLTTFATQEGGDYFKKASTQPLIKEFGIFFKNEVPLASDFNGQLIQRVKYRHNSYSNELDNDDKLIIINAKYKDLPQAFLFKALHAFHSRKYDLAIENIAKIKDAAEKYPYIDSILAYSYFKMKNNAKALLHKKKALKICPNDPIIANRLKDLK